MSLPLEFYADDHAVARLEATLAASEGLERRQALVAVAWQIRQRDSRRALALAEEALVGLTQSEHHHLQARLMLVRGEVKLLFGELDASAMLSAQALQIFTGIDDAVGCSDAHWLQFSVALGKGNAARADGELRAVADHAHRCGDSVRVTIAHAALASRDVFRDAPTARQRWGASFPSGAAGMHPAAATWVEDFFAAIASQGGQHVEAIRHHSISYTQALASGQIRRAVVVATNLGVEFNNLNDHHAALEWMQRGMDLARPQAWPGTMAVALLQTAGTLRELQQYDAASALLREAMVLMEPLAESRNYAVALRYLGEVELKRRQFADAFTSFERLEQRAIALNAADFLSNALRGQAEALSNLDQPQRALTQAHAALAAAQSHALHQVDALRAMADIHTRHRLPAPPGMQTASATLHYLQQAREVTATIANYTLPGDFLEALAQAHADVGDAEVAYELAKQAKVARQTTQSQEAINRAVAMQVTYETQRAHAEERHQRQLAEANAARADQLEQANEAYHSVLENAQDTIVLTDSQGHINHWNHQAVISFGWTLEEALGKDILAMLFPMRFRDDVGSAIARQQTVQQNTPRLETMALRRGGAEFPIELSVTSMRMRGQFECSFFIRDITQRREAELTIRAALERQQELNELRSRFVAMTSHEFRTPLATISSSQELLKFYSARLNEAEKQEILQTIGISVHRMTMMLDRVLLLGKVEAQMLEFHPQAVELTPLCEALIAEAKNQQVDSTCVVVSDWSNALGGGLFDENLLRHIFGNLLSNAIKYSPRGGVVSFKVFARGSKTVFEVSDQGIGVPAQDMEHLFESFHRGSNVRAIAGTGLGLAIVKESVNLHGGQITVQSASGGGTTFTVIL